MEKTISPPPNPASASSDTADLQRRPFRFYMRKHWRVFALGICALFFTNLFDILTPLALKSGVDAITNKNANGLLHAIALYSALMTGVTLFRYFWRIFFGRFHHSVADDLRNRIFTKLTSLDPGFYQKNPVGKLMSLITNDVNTFRMAIGPAVLILLDAIFLIVMILPVMMTLSMDWTWKTLILLPLVPFLMRWLERLIHGRFRVQQDRLAEVSAAAQEIVSGIRVIKGFAQEEQQRAGFNALSRQYEDACNKVAIVDSAFHPVMESGVALGSVILLWFCTPEVMRGEMTLGTFVAFHEYIRKMVWPMSAIGVGVSMFEQGRASFDRIGELLATETDVPDSGTETITRFENLEIHGLSFRYAGAPQPALRDIHLRIQAGETIGIVGPVGAGKTTLMQLICRLHPAEPGHIRINGVELERIRKSSLAETISFVPQDAFLFSDTIGDNIAFGLREDPGLGPIESAAAMVNIDREIHAIPERYDAFLGERGVNLSGGQKQRLTIARAMIRRSPVVILDDSLSAVDGNTEKAIVTELKSRRQAQAQMRATAQAKDSRQTVLIVSHRLATLKHADRIVVLDRGAIEAIGSHEELLEISPTYQALNQLQSAPPAPTTTITDAAGGVA